MRAADDMWLRLRTLLRVSDDSCVVEKLRVHISMLEQSQQDMLDAVPGNVAMLDEHGTILAVNTAWRLHADKNGLPDAAHFGPLMNSSRATAICRTTVRGRKALLP